jgi:hypothetical protein
LDTANPCRLILAAALHREASALEPDRLRLNRFAI